MENIYLLKNNKYYIIMQSIARYFCPNKNKYIKVCNLDCVYTMDQFKFYYEKYPVLLYEQMYYENNGFKIFISEYDEKEPTILLNHSDKFDKFSGYRHLALVASIFIDIPKTSNNQKININGFECNRPDKINVLENGKIITKINEILLNESIMYNCKYYWIYIGKKETIFDNNLFKYEIRSINGVKYYDFTSTLEKISLDMFNNARLAVENMDHSFNPNDEEHKFKIINKHFNHVSNCNWKLKNQFNIENKTNEEEKNDSEIRLFILFILFILIVLFVLLYIFY